MSNLRKVGVLSLLPATTTTATGATVEPWHINRTYEVYGQTASGSGAATVIIEVRNSEDADWKTLATYTLTLGVTMAGDGTTSETAWRYVRARVSVLSGTGATVYANLGAAPH